MCILQSTFSVYVDVLNYNKSALPILLRIILTALDTEHKALPHFNFDLLLRKLIFRPSRGITFQQE